MAKPVALLIPLLFVGCVTTDDRYARLKPYIGQSMADFSRATGLTPSDMYNTADGRTFVVNGPTTTVTVSPGVAVNGGCKMLIETTATNKSGSADDWRIVAINATGPC